MGQTRVIEATRKPDGAYVLRAGPGDLAAAAGTDRNQAVQFLETLRNRGYCSYTKKVIRILAPMGDNGFDWKSRGIV